MKKTIKIEVDGIGDYTKLKTVIGEWIDKVIYTYDDGKNYGIIFTCNILDVKKVKDCISTIRKFDMAIKLEIY